MSESTPARPRYRATENFPFWGVHIVALAGIIYYGWSWAGLGLAVILYFTRMFFVTAVYHRYFSHRTFKTSRFFQFVLAFLAQTSLQKGVLWWAGHHRRHHKYSDLPEDVHSVKQRGFWWAHVGWILSDQHNVTEWDRVRDFATYPELRLINTPLVNLLPGILLSVILFLVGGAHALLWGFFVSTVLLWHGTFTINSLTHVFGSTRYASNDESKNNWFLAIITMGEGWHNNHHRYQSSCNQGFYWWEYDVTYWLLRGMQALRLISEVRVAPQEILDEGRRPLAAATEATVVPPPVPPAVDPAP
jgi:stearoyl-CoA desaturase (Delta-9 desaturase)